MEVRLLDPGRDHSIFETYLEAFSDYSVPIHPPRPAFDAMLQRRGANWSHSVGAFDGPRLVGLQIMARGEFGSEGAPTAYNILTGVVPSHRGRGLARAMFERVLQSLESSPAERVLLECIQTNTAALAHYRRQGFEVTRSFECLEIPRHHFRDHADAANVAVRRIQTPQWVRLGDLRTWQPSWQNANVCLSRAEPAPTVLGAYRDESLMGYAALFTGSGDLAQFTVGQTHRGEGVGSALYVACLRRLEPQVDRLRLINIPSDAQGDLAFFRARGAEVFTRQYEMMRPL